MICLIFEILRSISDSCLLRTALFGVHVNAILLRFCQEWFSTLESFSKNQITELGCSLQSLETEENLILSILEDRFFKLTNIFANNILEIFFTFYNISIMSNPPIW